MTLNGRTALYCTNNASFRVHHKNSKRHTHTISSKDVAQERCFQGLKSSCIYSCGFRGEGHQTTEEWPEQAIFSNFRRHIFGTFRVEANIICQYYYAATRLSYWLSSDHKMLDLK